MNEDKEGCCFVTILISVVIAVVCAINHSTKSAGKTTFTGQIGAIEVADTGYKAKIVTDTGLREVCFTIDLANRFKVRDIVTVEVEMSNGGAILGVCSVTSNVEVR